MTEIKCKRKDKCVLKICNRKLCSDEYERQLQELTAKNKELEEKLVNLHKEFDAQEDELLSYKAQR